MHAMIFILRGKKILSYKHDQVELKEGHVALLTQNNYTMSEIVGKEGVYEALLIYFDDAFVLEFLQTYKIDTLHANEKARAFAFFDVDTLLRKEIDSLKTYAQHDTTYKDVILKLKVETIWFNLLQTKRPAMHGFFQAVCQCAPQRITHILESNLEMIESVEDMCKIAKVSKNRLYNHMKQIHRLTPKVWLDRKRLERAAFLLRHTDRSIADIATECGFSTLSWFGVRFKEKYGLSPTLYRINPQKV